LHAKPQARTLACYKSIRFISSIFPPTPRRPFKGSQAASGSVRYLRPPAFHPQNLLGYSIAAVKALCKKRILCTASRRTRFKMKGAAMRH